MEVDFTVSYPHASSGNLHSMAEQRSLLAQIRNKWVVLNIIDVDLFEFSVKFLN